MVVVGTGQAGLQLALSLREHGFEDVITLVGEEPGLPYGRPPLSKAFLAGTIGEEGLVLRRAEVLERQRIGLLAGDRAVGIDREAHLLHLMGGMALPYAHLVLATGTRSRPLPVLGADDPDVLSLRSVADARVLRERLSGLRRVVVAGAGFIGLEFAAVAAARGIAVEVIEAQERPMARAVSLETSRFLLDRHQGRGTAFHFGRTVTHVVRDREGLLVGCSGGEVLRADLLLVGIGAIPNDELAAGAGLQVANGVVVDEHLCTADPAISAIGDCAAHPNPHAGAVLRLESVQNAVDQARSLAARLVGRPEPYAAVPWFWSDQGPDKLQIAGLAMDGDDCLALEEADRLAVFRFRGRQLVALETVNRPGDHMLARRVLAGGRTPHIDEVAASGFTLKRFLEREPLPA